MVRSRHEKAFYTSDFQGTVGENVRQTKISGTSTSSDIFELPTCVHQPPGAGRPHSLRPTALS